MVYVVSENLGHEARFLQKSVMPSLCGSVLTCELGGRGSTPGEGTSTRFGLDPNGGHAGESQLMLLSYY